MLSCVCSVTDHRRRQIPILVIVGLVLQLFERKKKPSLCQCFRGGVSRLRISELCDRITRQVVALVLSEKELLANFNLLVALA